MLTRKSGRRNCLGVLVVAGVEKKKIVEGKGFYIGGGKISVPPFVLSAASLSDKTEGKVINLWRSLLGDGKNGGTGSRQGGETGSPGG
jgi:hypothetical protein